LLGYFDDLLLRFLPSGFSEIPVWNADICQASLGKACVYWKYAIE